MITLKINPKKTFLPLKIAKGTTSERLDRAIKMNDEFHEILKKNFTDGEMSRFRFSKLLQKSAGNKIPVNYYDEWSTTGEMRHIVDENSVCAGYFTIFPKNINSDKVKSTTMKSLLRITQDFFTEILNPKIFAREISMFNKGENLKAAQEFFNNEINIIGEINTKKLAKYLKPLSQEEKIDTLQFFRYGLMKEENANQFAKHYMRKLNRTPYSETKYSENAITSNPYKYPDKIKIIETELTKILQQARSKK